MRRFRLLGVSLLVVFVVGVVVSGLASAALPEFLPVGATTLTATGGISKLETLGGTSITCEETKGEAQFLSGSDLGPFHISFTKNCKSVKPIEGLTCNSTSMTGGDILVLGTVHMVFDTLSPALGAAALFLVEPLTFTCGGGLTTTEVKGSVLCLVSPINKLLKTTETATLKCEQNAGDPKEVTYWNSSGTKVTLSGATELLSNTNGAGFEMSGQEAGANLSFNRELELMA